MTVPDGPGHGRDLTVSLQFTATILVGFIWACSHTLMVTRTEPDFHPESRWYAMALMAVECLIAIGSIYLDEWWMVWVFTLAIPAAAGRHYFLFRIHQLDQLDREETRPAGFDELHP